MRKRFTVLLATILCLLSLGLVACGTNASDNGGASPAVNPADKFIGSWKMAAMSSRGITMIGDLSQMMNIDVNMQLTIADGGTATMIMNNDSADLTWQQVDDYTLKLTVASDKEESEGEAEVMSDDDGTIELAYQDGALVMEVVNDGEATQVTFTHDGTLKGYEAITADSGTAITSISGLEGTWNLTGMSMMGISMFGDADTLVAALQSEEGTDYTLVLGADNTVSFFGSTASLKLTDNGAAITVSGMDIPLLAHGNDLLVDMSSAFGFEMVMRYSK